MATKEKLYDAFGELLYAVAKADGSVQNEEMKTLSKVLEEHSFGTDIMWSFNYESKNRHTVKEAYSKALDVFKEHGPFEEYEKFAKVLELVAAASGGINQDEKNIIKNFRKDLIATFQNNPDIL